MIVTHEILLDFLFDKAQEKLNIDNTDEIKEYCKSYIHYPLLNNPKVKKDISEDIVWTEDTKELIRRYKVIINKYSLTIVSIFPFKINNIMAWLFDGGLVEIPALFLYYKNEIKNILWYLHNSFLGKLKFVMLLNEYGNDLYNNNELKTIQFYKFIIQQQKLQRNDLIQYFPKKNYKKEFNNRLKELNLTDTGNGNGLFELVLTGIFGNIDIANLIEKSYGEKIDNNNNNINNKEEIQNILNQNESEKLLNDEKTIKNLSQEIIDKLQLTIFDIRTIKKKNLILYIFIDKDNMKRYYYEPFEYTFFISTNGNIIYNDYIVDFDPKIHLPYTFTNYEMVNKFKFALNDIYKKQMIKFLK